MLQVHRVTLLIIDHDEVGPDGVKDLLEKAKYPNYCIAPTVVDMASKWIEWDDSHPLNQKNAWRKEFNRLFPS